MCIVSISTETSNCQQRPLERYEVGDYCDGLDGGGAGVRPARELVQVVAEARDLPAALALDGDGRRGPRPRHGLLKQLGWLHAGNRGLGPPGGKLGGRHAGGDNHGAAISHQRTVTMFRGAMPPARLRRRSGAGCRGFEGGRSVPLASDPCATKGTLTHGV